MQPLLGPSLLLVYITVGPASPRPSFYYLPPALGEQQRLWPSLNASQKPCAAVPQPFLPELLPQLPAWTAGSVPPGGQRLPATGPGCWFCWAQPCRGFSPLPVSAGGSGTFPRGRGRVGWASGAAMRGLSSPRPRSWSWGCAPPSLPPGMRVLALGAEGEPHGGRDGAGWAAGILPARSSASLTLCRGESRGGLPCSRLPFGSRRDFCEREFFCVLQLMENAFRTSFMLSDPWLHTVCMRVLQDSWHTFTFGV